MAADFATTVAEVLAETRTDPTLVTLEMTESVFIQDSDRALIVLNELKRLGVKLALDDFGTGYSSLSYLKQFPVNIVKIDRAFIADLGSEPTSRLIVSAIVRLAHSLQMTVVAEGIESAHQYDEVVALDCDSYQGYFFARPASADALDSLMASAGATAATA
jgi:EAL domain-containing protein (putative c-di-GMP-specific phosphodiesterase class I)